MREGYIFLVSKMMSKPGFNLDRFCSFLYRHCLTYTSYLSTFVTLQTDNMAVAFIQGASRGIGLEFCRALSARGGVEVVVGCRDPTSAPALASLPRVTPLQCDVTR